MKYAAGMVVGGKYQIDQVLGIGGMGVVVAATHLQLGSRVALKFLLDEMATHPSVVERFLREARASAQLQSEHACKVIDVDRLPDGVPYFVMEHLNGHDLADMLATSGPVAAPVVADWILQALQALAEAHAVGIVHRDIKPGNLFLAQRANGKPIVKVLDFGVAKSPETRDFSLTQTATVIGSPGYMSPEQLKSSKVVDMRSDIWSLGIVMYELVTGRQPFLADSITALAVSVCTDPIPNLPANLPPGFIEIIERCLEKDPARRFANVGMLAAALAPFAAGGHDAAQGVSHVLRASQPVVESRSLASASTPTTLRHASGVVEGGVPRRRSSAVAAGLIGAVVAAIAIGMVILGGSKTEPTVETPTTSKAPAAATTSEPTPSPPTVVEVVDAAVVDAAVEASTTPPTTTKAATQTTKRTSKSTRKPPKPPKPKTPSVEDLGESRK